MKNSKTHGEPESTSRKISSDYRLKIDVLYRYYKEKQTLAEIGEKIFKSTSAVGKIKKEAEKEFLINIIRAPQDRRLVSGLRDSLGINYVHLAANGKRKNSEQIGYELGKYLCLIVRDMAESKNEINVAVSCGETIKFACKRFVSELYDNHICLKGKVINVFPSALIGGLNFSTISPSFTASRLADRLLSLPDDIRPIVNCFNSTVPPGFYAKSITEEDRKIIDRHFGYQAILPDPVDKLDIVLTGIGTTIDADYLAACKLSGIGIEPRDQSKRVPEVNFSPINDSGVIPSYEGIIQGIKFSDMKELSGKNDKHVIAAIGGKAKQAASLVAFANPYFNTLFTDFDICEHWLSKSCYEG